MNLLDVVLALLILYVGYEIYYYLRGKFLRRRIEKNIVMLYPEIVRFDRKQINTLRNSLRNSEGLIRQDVIDRARFLLTMREGVLNVEEKKSSN